MSVEPELTQRLDQLAARLDRLERIVNNLVSHASRGAAPSPAPWVRPEAPPARASELTAAQARAIRAYATDDAPEAPEASPSAARAGMEQFIGMRAFAYAGGVVVIFAVALFLRLAYQEGWFQVLTPQHRCIAVGALGVAFLIAAELTRRRISLIAAAGLNVAGLGSLYASAYAAAAIFDLMPPSIAMIALAITAVLGVLIGVRAQLPLVSILAVLMGYAAPFLLDDTLSHALVVPAYLGALLATSLVVASTRPRAFVALRHIAASGTMIAGGVWAREQVPVTMVIVLVFLGAVWAALHADAARESLRNDRRDVVTPLLVALVSTAWAATLGLDSIQYAIRPESLDGHWHWPAFLGVLSLAIALPVGRITDGLRNPLRDARSRLANVCWVQGVALGVIALGLAFQDWPREASWVALGLTLTIAAWRFRAHAFQSLALMVLVLAAIFALAARLWGDSPTIWGVFGFQLTLHAAIALASAGVLLLQGVLAVAESRWSRTIGVVSAWWAVAITGLTCVVTKQGDNLDNLTLAWTLIAALAAVGHSALPRLRLRGAALVLLPLVLFAWWLEYSPGRWFGSAAPLFLHPALYTGLAIALVGAFIARCDVRDAAQSPETTGFPSADTRLAIAVTTGLAAFALVFATTSAEIARAASTLTDDPLTRSAAVSVYWAVLAVGLIAFGFVRRVPYVRHIGLGLMAVTAGKAILVDASHTAEWARIIAVLTIGMLMLAIAIAYARLNAIASRSA